MQVHCADAQLLRLHASLLVLRGVIAATAQVAAMPWGEVCTLWKEYMTAIADSLAAAGAPSGAPAPRLARMLYEAGMPRSPQRGAQRSHKAHGDAV